MTTKPTHPERGEESGEEKAGKEWRRRVRGRPTLGKESTPQDVEVEAEFIRLQLQSILNEYASRQDLRGGGMKTSERQEKEWEDAWKG